MRADRLLAAVLVLQARGRVTAAELAEELEVSVRTARRDLEALSAAGVPVYPQRGRDGGWQLIGGYRTDLSGLTAHEARALFLVAGPSATSTPQVRAALRKLVRALPEPMRAGAEAASAAVVVDPSGWGRAEPDVPPFLDLLRDAVIARRRVELGYAAPRRPATVRTVDPFGLVAKRGVWYLVAGTDAGQRTFRVERVISAVVLDEVVEIPADFDLATVWADVVDTFDTRWQPPITVRVEVDVDAVRYVTGRYGQRAEVVEPGDGSSPAILDIGFPDDHVAAAELAGWPDGLDVKSPDSVRSRLAAIGARLTDRYG